MLFTEKSVTIYTEHSSVMKRLWKRYYPFYFHITYLCILHFAYYTFVRCQQIYNEMCYINN